MPAERFDFPSADGNRLSARLDLPAGPVQAYALFAHCFTCGKDINVAGRIAAALARRGIATVRFDFTGLGGSEGDFANTDFSSNCADLLAAIAHMRAANHAPSLLIGHSLGGAAVLAVAADAPEVRAVAVIGAPFDVGHVVHQFREKVPEIEAAGEAVVNLAGRPFTIRRDFLDDVAHQDQRARIANLHRALLVMHSPIDSIVGIDNAREIFEAARHPKSFISLDDADHLLSRPADAAYAASLIAGWAARYLPPLQAGAAPASGHVVVEETGRSLFEQAVMAGHHRFLADEPIEAGGKDAGPGPYDLLLAGLGACTSMTLRLYANRKKLPLQRVRVTLQHRRVHAEDCADCEESERKLEVIDREITLTGTLDEAQRTRLMEIADKCPVHRTLTSKIDIRTTRAAD
jgi:uncharacterized OsmC-like protein/pimeloyl-ACP methyl ester carboxylesterase